MKEYNLKPLARLVAFSSVGVQPEIMGIGPVPAIENVLRVANEKLDNIDLIEVRNFSEFPFMVLPVHSILLLLSPCQINEAFGVQTLACAQALKLDQTKLNVNGGAIALGHPLAASGSRITAHLVHELQRKKLKKAIGSACIGGGQGIALLIEAV